MKDVSVDDSLVTAQEAADMLGVSLRTVHRMRADGELQPIHLETTGRAKRTRFRRSDIEARIRRVAAQVSA